MKLLKTAFLLAAAAIAPSIARADIIDIAPSTGGYMMYGSDQIWASADGTALIGNAYMSNNYVFWSQATGRLTGIADALTVPNATSYRLDGLNTTGTKLYGTAYDTIRSGNKPIIWTPGAGSYVDVLASVNTFSYAYFGSSYTGGTRKFTVSEDASRAYGTYMQAGVTKVFRWDLSAGVTTDLIGSINAGNSNCDVQQMSSDGNKIVGVYYTTVGTHGFYWSQATGAIDIGNSTGFSVNTQLNLNLMTSTGSHVFADKYDGSNWKPFRWNASDFTSIELPKPNGSYGMYVQIASPTGDKAFGYYQNASYGYDLFKWTEAGNNIVNLTSLPAGYKEFKGASADLRYLYGRFDANGNTHTFRYDDTTATFVDLHAGLSGYYYPNKMSTNGTYIVGNQGSINAWRWSVTDGYQTIGAWLLANGADPTLIGNWIFKNANFVSDDGNTVIGSGTLSGTSRYYIASATSGVADHEIWLSSINGQNRIYATGSTLAGLPLEGAHHRPMLSFDRMGKESQAWATGDFGSSSRTRDVHVTSGEAGINWNVGKTMLFGIAGGHAVQNADLDLGGSSATKGDFFIAELDYRPEGTQWIVSLLGMVGSWESKTNRGYDNGGSTDFSNGVADTITRSARLRVDAPAVATFGGFGFAPFASYTVTQTVVGAYTETGGGFPASFNEQEHNATEARLGVTASKDLSEKTKLLLSVEGIHRFDGVGPSLTGQDVTGGVSFDLPGTAPRPDCVRFGFDVDHKLSADTLLNISAHVSTVGEAHDVSAAISIRRAF